MHDSRSLFLSGQIRLLKAFASVERSRREHERYRPDATWKLHFLVRSKSSRMDFGTLSLSSEIGLGLLLVRENLREINTQAHTESTDVSPFVRIKLRHPDRDDEARSGPMRDRADAIPKTGEGGSVEQTIPWRHSHPRRLSGSSGGCRCDGRLPTDKKRDVQENSQNHRLL